MGFAGPALDRETIDELEAGLERCLKPLIALGTIRSHSLFLDRSSQARMERNS